MQNYNNDEYRNNDAEYDHAYYERAMMAVKEFVEHSRLVSSRDFDRVMARYYEQWDELNTQAKAEKRHPGHLNPVKRWMGVTPYIYWRRLERFAELPKNRTSKAKTDYIPCAAKDGRYQISDVKDVIKYFEKPLFLETEREFQVIRDRLKEIKSLYATVRHGMLKFAKIYMSDEELSELHPKPINMINEEAVVTESKTSRKDKP